MDNEIDISIIDNTTGIPQETDGIMMKFIWAVAVANTFNLNTAYLITGLEDAAALGINAAYDVTNSTAVFQQIEDYYGEAGDGTLLWIVGVPMNTAYATYAVGTQIQPLIRFTALADFANRAKMIGFCYAPPATLQTATDFPADVPAAITALQALQVQMFLAGYQWSFIVDGYNMSSTVTPSTLGTQATNSAYAGSLCITGTQPNGVSAVGLALGRFARISIGHGFGAVADGPRNTAAAYLTNGLQIKNTATALVVGHIYTVLGGTVLYNSITYPTGGQFTALMGITTWATADTGYLADNLTSIGAVPGVSQSQIGGISPTDIKQLGQKQFLFLRTWEGKSGFFWNDGSTCISSTKSFSSQEYNRVANSLAAAALSFFTEFMGQNLPLDKSTGNLAQGWINTQQEEYYDTYIGPLNDTGGTGDVSDAALTITGVNFGSTRKLTFALSIEASIILGGVNGTVQFVQQL